MPPVFEEAPRKIEPTEVQNQENEQETPPPPPPFAPVPPEAQTENEEQCNISSQNEERLSQTHNQDGNGTEEARDLQTTAVDSDSLDVSETKAGSEQVAANHVAESASPNGAVNEN